VKKSLPPTDDPELAAFFAAQSQFDASLKSRGPLVVTPETSAVIRRWAKRRKRRKLGM